MMTVGRITTWGWEKITCIMLVVISLLSSLRRILSLFLRVHTKGLLQHRPILSCLRLSLQDIGRLYWRGCFVKLALLDSGLKESNFSTFDLVWALQPSNYVREPCEDSGLEENGLRNQLDVGITSRHSHMREEISESTI